LITVSDELVDLLLGVDAAAFDVEAESWTNALEAAFDRRVHDEELQDVQRAAASHGCWNAVYALSAASGLETSVLIDAEGTVFIDWGSPGLVPVRMHVGALAPFRVWTHTHPRFGAYWSSTDRESLGIATGIVRTALVLGRDGVKRAQNATFEANVEERLATTGALASWSAEAPVPWTEDWQQEAFA